MERGDVVWLEAVDKKKIAAYFWDNIQSPVGIVQISHGMMEHAHRYNRFARFLNEHGFIVAADDHRGHGVTAATDDSLGYAGKDGFNRTVKDMRMLTVYLKNKYPGLPVILMGHSYGSFLCQAYAELYGEDLSGLILSGSAKNSNPAMAAVAVLAKAEMIVKGDRYISKRLGKIVFGGNNKKVKNPENGSSWLNRDDEEVRRYINDPWCGNPFSCSFYYDFLRGLLDLSKKENRGEVPSDLPIYIFSGEMDPVGGYGKFVKKLYRQYVDHEVEDVTIKLYPHGRHEMIHEINYEKVYGDILTWMRRVLWNKRGSA